MNQRPPRQPLVNEGDLRTREMRRNNQLYAYGMTQRLSFFVISIELIFCGYILLNSENLGAIKYSSYLFLLAGLAAISGILWRMIYNQTYHEQVHGIVKKWNRTLKKLQIIVYWIYIILTSAFLIFTIAAGYLHLNNIENRIVQKQITTKNIQEFRFEKPSVKNTSTNNTKNHKEKTSIENISDGANKLLNQSKEGNDEK